MGILVWLAAAPPLQDQEEEQDRVPLSDPRNLFRTEEEPELQPGPLDVRGHSLFQVATVDFSPDAPLYIPAGRMEIHTSVTWLNIFNYVEGQYLIDGEFARASATLWYGLTDRWQVGVTLPIEYIGGGVMDTFIEAFHEISASTREDGTSTKRGSSGSAPPRAAGCSGGTPARDSSSAT